MSYSRSSINDYPEHLNPFYEGDIKSKFLKSGKVKRSSSFGEALRNALLFKSIRGKKKKQQQVNSPSSPPELRRNETRVGVQYRQTLPTISSPSPSPSRVSVPVPLPRSRFSERVARPREKNSTLSANPFEEGEDDLRNDSSARLKRRKRKAPLPPNSVTSYGTSSISSTHNSSKWSLTSEATDISAYSDNEHTRTDPIDPSVSINISNIVKEIEKLSEEGHLEQSEEINVPDTSIEVTVQCDQPTDENFNVVPETCDKDIEEVTCVDIEYHTNSFNEEHASDAEKEHESEKGSDSLTNLINSIELNNDNNKLDDKADSLTNIINSINMIENECYESPVAVTESSKGEVTVLTDIEEILSGADEFEESTTKEEKIIVIIKNESGSDLSIS